MAFKPRPPKANDAEERPTKKYKIEKPKTLELPPAQSFEELDERVRDLHSLQMKKGRPSDLRRRVEHIEAILQREGLMPNDNAKGTDEENSRSSELGNLPPEAGVDG